MPVSYIGADAAAASSITIPAHIAGDVLVVWAVNDNTTTAVTVPAGWTSLRTASNTWLAGVVAYRKATASGTASGTWTNATNIAVAVYRGVGEIGNHAQANSVGSTTWTIPAVTLSGTSWVTSYVYFRGNKTSSPSGMTNRASVGLNPTNEVYDTNAAVSSFAAKNGTSSANREWMSFAVELRDVRLITSSISMNLTSIVAYRTGRTDDLSCTSSIGNLALTVAGDVVRNEGQYAAVTSTTSVFTSLTLSADNQKLADGTSAVNLLTTLDGTITSKDTLDDSAMPLSLPLSGLRSFAEKNTTSAMPLTLNVFGGNEVESDNSNGLISRLVAYVPNGGKKGPLSSPMSWNASITYGAPGAINIDYGKGAQGYDWLTGPLEVAIETYNGQTWQEAPDARYMILTDDRDEADNDPKGTFAGVQFGFILRKARVYDGPTDGTTPGERRFTSSTVGRIMKTFLDEAKARGWGPAVTYDFTATADSNGRPWTLNKSLAYSVGEVSLDAVLSNLIDLGMCEASWDGRTLHIYDTDTASRDFTVNNDDQVVVRIGRDITEAPRKTDRTELASTAIVQGSENLSIEVTNPTAETPWGRWEALVNQGGVEDLATLQSIGEQATKVTGVAKVEKTHALNLIKAKRLPLQNYVVGDWVYSDTGSGLQKFRVMGITLSSDKAGITQANITLNDIIDETEVKIARKVDGIIGGATRNGPKTNPSDPNDKTTPNAPTSLSGVVSLFMDENRERAEVKLTWTLPTKNTDGSNFTDQFATQVWAKPSRAGTTWRLLTSTEPGVNTVTTPALDASETYSFKVNVIDYSSHASAYSNTVTLNLGQDKTAPKTPSIPSLSSRNGILEIAWDGKMADGTDPGIDLSKILVYASTSSTFTAGTTTLVGSIPADKSTFQLTGKAYLSVWYARFVAVDYAGNKSGVSGRSAGAAISYVESGDLGDNSVGPGELNVPGIDANGNLNVNNLNGKTLTGITINGGLFRSTNTSQRVEMGATGPNDPADEVRWFNSGSVVSIRNPSDRTGWLRINASNAIFDLGRSSDGWPQLDPAGAANLKFIGGGIQIRNSGDTGYGVAYASAFTVSSEAKLKKWVSAYDKIDDREILRSAGLKKWTWKKKNRPIQEVDFEQEAYGLIADELPDWMRDGEGYDVTRVVAFLWESLKRADARIAALEKKGKS